MNVAYNEDCMKVMARYPDKYFDLAVVDPPYGNGGGGGSSSLKRDLAEHSTGISRTGGTWAAKYAKKS